MNFIEAVKLLELDKDIQLMRKSKDFKIAADNAGIFLVNYFIPTINFTASIEEILANDWYVCDEGTSND